MAAACAWSRCAAPAFHDLLQPPCFTGSGVAHRLRAGPPLPPRAVLRMLLSNFYDAGYKRYNGKFDIDQDSELAKWARFYEVDIPTHMAKKPYEPVDSDPNPFVWVDMNKCIQCTRCVRRLRRDPGALRLVAVLSRLPRPHRRRRRFHHARLPLRILRCLRRLLPHRRPGQ